MEGEIRIKAEACIQIAMDFTRLFYRIFDRRRTQTVGLFVEGGTFVWNGNGASSKDDIQKILSEIAPSNHILTTLDAQPVVDAAVGDHKTLAIQASGTVKHLGLPTINFFQSFLITSVEDKWRIVTTTYRTLEPLF